MVGIELTFPAPEIEEAIVAHEAALDRAEAARLVSVGQAIRRVETSALREVASTRVLVAAGRLIAAGLPAREAARAAVAGPLTDDPAVTAGLVPADRRLYWRTNRTIPPMILTLSRRRRLRNKYQVCNRERRHATADRRAHPVVRFGED